MYGVVIVRYGEVAVKSPRVRRRMERALLESLEFALERAGVRSYELRREGGRVFVETDQAEAAARALARVFGVVSTSPAVEVGDSLDDIVRASLELGRQRLRRGMSFAVRARRVRTYELTSKDIERVVGEAVLSAVKGVRVNLEEPDYVIYVEVREGRAYVFDSVLRGPGGLPYGVEGRVVSLVSGGVDSAVATWLAMKRGCEVVPVHFFMGAFYSPEARERALAVLRWLREWVPRRELRAYWAPLHRAHEELGDVRERYRCLVCKALMYKVGELICRAEGCAAMVTGESIGQVASQTLSNLSYLSRAVATPIIRPVVAMDKDEIAGLARRLGVFEVAGRDVGRCRLAPRRPATRVGRRGAEYIASLPLDELARVVAEEAEVMSVE